MNRVMPILNEQGLLDPDKSVYITALGKKGSGKSKLSRVIFDSYPYDRAIIDINGDDKPIEVDDPDSNFWEIKTPPESWPEHLRKTEGQLTIYYNPDSGSETFLEDQDKFVGMCYEHGKMLLLVHEMGILAPSQKTPKNVKRLLHQGRHKDLSTLMCAPRPITMNPLVISQSNFVYVFKLPNPRDRRVVADVIGWDPEDFDLAVRDLEEHGYLRYDDSASEESGNQLLSFPPIPESELPK